MSRREARPIFYVCAALIDQKLILKTIQGITQQEAMDQFASQYGTQPTEVQGPFYKKRFQVLETTRELKFTSQVKKAVFNGWIVNAFTLIEPADQVFLVFIKRIDGKKMASPKGTITVPLSQIKVIHNEEEVSD